jgi:hypothetical protein
VGEIEKEREIEIERKREKERGISCRRARFAGDGASRWGSKRGALKRE